MSQLLGVAELDNGTGKAQADAVLQAIKEWELEANIIALSFDTTSSNTGKDNGACVLIENGMGRPLLHLACRHHVMELIIGAVFKVHNAASSAPRVPMFKRFKDNWSIIDKTKYEPGLRHEAIATMLEGEVDVVIEFARSILQECQPRDDYKEFAELVLTFLDQDRGHFLFRKPGAMHHARWMSKVIYALKIWMFRGQFKLTRKEEQGIMHVCVFAVRVYFKAWMQAPLAAKAPAHDLELLKTLVEYKSINKESADAALKKLKKHSWYLQPELACLALFDDDVALTTKAAMVQRMNQPLVTASDLKDDTAICNYELEDFVSEKSMMLFHNMAIPSDFLSDDPETWPRNTAYQDACRCIRALKVVNDQAERAVALTQSYNGSLTKNEEQLQALLKVVEKHRHKFPNCQKSTLLRPASHQ